VRALAHAKLGERERANELANDCEAVEGELAAAVREELRDAMDPAARPI